MRILAGLFFIVGVIMGNESGIKQIQINTIKIPVVYETSSVVPMGYIRLVFQGGGFLGDGEKIGLTTLRDELLEHGSKTKGNTGFAKALEQKAISLDVQSTNETLSFSLQFLKEEQKSAIELLGELLADPNFTQEEFAKAQTAVIAKILASQDDFDYLANRLLASKLFAGTPLAQSKLGTQQDIQKLSLQDVKDSFMQALALKRLIIVIGGDVDIDKTLKDLKGILRIPAGQEYQKTSFAIQSKPSTTIEFAKTQQAYIYFGSPLYAKNFRDENYLASVASFILGSSGFGSRLMEEVRVKRGLAYSAYIRFTPKPLASYTSGYLQTKLESKDEAIQVVKDVVADFVKNGATKQELEDAKQFLLGSEPLRNETLSQRLGTKFSNYYHGLGLDFRQVWLQQIKNLDLDTLNAYIKSHPEINDLTFAVITADEKLESKPTKKTKEKK